ncbi:hypothetical protein [Hyphomonas sp.]|uniref:hypothetical protein n=1 Tax=Hyphomonas sp. TaxID=87 RepID=UPI00391A2463
MAIGLVASTPEEAIRTRRLAALLILAIALALGVWRAASLLTGPDMTHHSPAEASLAALVEPLSGKNRARVSVTHNREGGRTVFVLLDAGAGAVPVKADVERVLTAAAGIDPARGDRLAVEETVFARGLPGRPDAAAWAELGALGIMGLLAAAIAMFPGRAPAASVTVRAETRPEIRPEASIRPLRPAAVPLPSDAVELARRDPAKAAEVLRGWIGARDKAG